MDFEVVTGRLSQGNRWANLRVNLASGPCDLASIWEGPDYDGNLEVLREKCRGLSGLLKDIAELSNKSLREFRQELKAESRAYLGES